MVSPVTLADSGEARNRAASPTSSWVMSRRSGRALGGLLGHRPEARDAARGQRAHRARRDGVDADAAVAEVPRQVADDRLERGLGHAHHVVAGHRAVGGDVGERHDRAAAAGAHVGLHLAGERGERVGRDVERQVEARAAGVDEAAAEVLRLGVGHGVHQDVDAAQGLGRARPPRP